MKFLFIILLNLATIPAFATQPCGLSGSINDRIHDCKTVKDNFALVARTQAGLEVYQDLQSKILWSETLADFKSESDFDSRILCHSDLPEVAGITGVAWRLPPKTVFESAIANGLLTHVPSLDAEYWTSTREYPIAGFSYIYYLRPDGTFGTVGGSSSFRAAVRCIANP